MATLLTGLPNQNDQVEGTVADRGISMDKANAMGNTSRPKGLDTLLALSLLKGSQLGHVPYIASLSVLGACVTLETGNSIGISVLPERFYRHFILPMCIIVHAIITDCCGQGGSCPCTRRWCRRPPSNSDVGTDMNIHTAVFCIILQTGVYQRMT